MAWSPRSGVTGGSGYTSAPLVTIASPTTAVIPTSGPGSPVVSYTNPGSIGTVTYTPVSGQSGTAVVTVTVTDSGGTANGGMNSVSQSFIVAVAPSNLAPVVTTTATPLTYLQLQAPTPVDPGLTLTDNNTPTNTTIVGATVQILVNNNPSQDVLSFSPQNGINATGYNPATGTLTLTGTATIAQYQAALRSVTYFNSSTNPTPLTRQVTFTVDDGATVNNLGSASRTINITPVNIAPTLNPIPNPAPIFENSGVQTIDLSGITAGGGQAQTITIAALSNNTGLIPTPTVPYTSPNTSGSLSFTPMANVSGTATITVTVTDNGGTLNGGVATVSQTFTVTVLPVNQPPTLTAIANPAAIFENTTTPQTIPLLAIGAGPGNVGESLNISAVSSNPGLIPNPSINYTTANTSGTLTFAPLPNVSGQAIILVTVMNDGGTANGGINSLTRSFTITVTPVNQAPTLNAIQDPQPVFENSISALSPATVALSGITDGPGDTGQVLTVSAVSSNPALVPNPTVIYTNPNTTGTLLYSLAPNASGKATITVTVTDNGGTANGGVNTFSQTFNIVVLPVSQAPTLGPIASPNPILENSAGETISLSGITAGPGDTLDLAVVVTNLTPSIIATPTVNYMSPNATGTLTIVPQAFATGLASFMVSVVDDGSTANGGVTASVPQLVTVMVEAVNQPPQINAVTNITIPENTPAAVATASIAGGAVNAINLTSGGSFYQSAPTVTISPPVGGIQATATASVNSNGVVTAINHHQSRLGLHNGPGGHHWTDEHLPARHQPRHRRCWAGRHQHHRNQQQPDLDSQAGDYLPQHQPDDRHRRPDERYTQLYPGGQRQRHGPDHAHRDGQRRHGQRRQEHVHRDVQHHRLAGQPAPDAEPDQPQSPGVAAQPAGAVGQLVRHQRRPEQSADVVDRDGQQQQPGRDPEPARHGNGHRDAQRHHGGLDQRHQRRLGVHVRTGGHADRWQWQRRDGNRLDSQRRGHRDQRQQQRLRAIRPLRRFRSPRRSPPRPRPRQTINGSGTPSRRSRSSTADGGSGYSSTNPARGHRLGGGIFSCTSRDGDRLGWLAWSPPSRSPIRAAPGYTSIPTIMFSGGGGGGAGAQRRRSTPGGAGLHCGPDRHGPPLAIATATATLGGGGTTVASLALTPTNGGARLYQSARGHALRRRLLQPPRPRARPC